MAFASSSSKPSYTSHCIFCSLLFLITWDHGRLVTLALADTPAAVKAPPGNISRVEQAVGFHIYYGQSFKVIKNAVDSKSYLLIQGGSRMAARTKYCTMRIKSFVIPLANFSADTVSFPVSFFELLGLLGSIKGITSDSIASECVLKAYKAGQIEKVNYTSPQQMSEFAAHFISNTDQPQACNFATFSPQVEDSALQVSFQLHDMCLANLATKRGDSTIKPSVAWMAYGDVSVSLPSEGPVMPLPASNSDLLSVYSRCRRREL